jgi:hypothetical protein
MKRKHNISPPLLFVEWKGDTKVFLGTATDTSDSFRKSSDLFAWAGKV